MKIMIIGSEGMLGHDLVDILSVDNEVNTTTIDTLDITDINKTIKTVKENNPDVLIHAAAFTGIYQHPEILFLIMAALKYHLHFWNKSVTHIYLCG